MREVIWEQSPSDGNKTGLGGGGWAGGWKKQESWQEGPLYVRCSYTERCRGAVFAHRCVDVYQQVLWIQLRLVCGSARWVDPLTMSFFLVCPRPRTAGPVTTWQLSPCLEGAAQRTGVKKGFLSKSDKGDVPWPS